MSSSTELLMLLEKSCYGWICPIITGACINSSCPAAKWQEESSSLPAGTKLAGACGHWWTFVYIQAISQWRNCSGKRKLYQSYLLASVVHVLGGCATSSDYLGWHFLLLGASQGSHYICRWKYMLAAERFSQGRSDEKLNSSSAALARAEPSPLRKPL